MSDDVLIIQNPETTVAEELETVLVVAEELPADVVEISEMGPVGPQGVPGDTSAAEAMIADLKAHTAIVVQVTSPDLPRPDAPLVLWVGGQVEPLNMGADDLWAPRPA